MIQNRYIYYTYANMLKRVLREVRNILYSVSWLWQFNQSESFLHIIHIRYQYVPIVIVFHDLQCDCVALRIENTQTFLHNTKEQRISYVSTSSDKHYYIVECFKVYCTTKGVIGCAIVIAIEYFKLQCNQILQICVAREIIIYNYIY